ncbi:hypothetical protein COE01_14855 [Bacillus thuringiensis]|uniref:hypothetical protein n=1 Tax=Bacillus thuringiensis TaxID=1428 RepID=UPI000BF7EF54|nr:hypothetical protein [Bacillus thuringiensis]PEW44421.1 hypothetical protein CN444_18220 [Bacillus thuringiensis]PFK07725.1 hypothetical protein COJ17_28150 [Bacillus thuringiensis]PGW83298.1 hypothetical protein COE01_14855 [Bacillus thuringiensis]
MENPNKDKTCFIITPIGDDQSDIRRAADGVIDAVIIPSLLEIGFQKDNIKVAHRMANPGSINKQVIESIIESDLAIANLTTLNPNVMYELAIRHAVRKPVIQICQKGTRLPFDITEERTIFYTNDMTGVLELGNDFKLMLLQAINDKEPDNPIYRVIESNTIMKSIDASDPSKYLFEHMNKLENQLSDLASSLKDDRSELNYRNNFKTQNGERTKTVRFKVDNSITSGEQVKERLFEIQGKDPEVELKFGITNTELIVKIRAPRVLAIDSVIDDLLTIEGISPIDRMVMI